ncbi:dTDP-4-amino-4,6-dideoxyglucose formyltransferase [Phaeodactylibacter xiamenensis]|uniref:dTDP-4-amino-4,6-dideoxyglucose formyltransferase n=1 Tax=Phaeodactylibacter xiamenensis TaxID=1524460 RepID=UPI003BA9D564
MKVLVIIDNIIQYERVKHVFKKTNLSDVSTDFYHSPIKSKIWEHPDFLDQDKMLDVKNDADSIIENYDLVISIHCFQFFPAKLVNSVRCINIHPGYNPINRGWYPQVFAIIDDLPIGATIHEMDEKLDNGPIIARAFVDKYKWDTSFTIYNRVLDKEIELFQEYFEAIIMGTYEPTPPEDTGNIYRKRDFEALCEIDLNQKGDFNQFFDRLRALSHGDYKNAFFYDEETGKKVYFKLSIEIE